VYDAASVYGTSPQMPSMTGLAAPTTRMGTDSLVTGWRGLLHPDNPLFWLGGIVAVTLGLIGVSGSVRLGRARIAASVDQT